MVNYSKIDSILKDTTVNKSGLASTNADLVTEISNCASEIEAWYKQSTIEEAIKSIFWHGTLKDYGTFGVKTLQTRNFYNKKTKTYYDLNQTIGRWKLLSIDFGVTNIGREFSLTHTGIVIADYSGMVVVLPITSQDSVDLSKVPNDIKKSFIPVSKVECQDLAKDSYVLIHQIRAVSKNRITKRGIIGKIENTSVQQKIEKKSSEKTYIIYEQSFGRFRK
ncbi:type II toxin-antitoxin system PemK/MazF family toxin [Lysinibacillus boronitolerans]|uniref:type II toxin-antitoxin system PemK/MazF family toxin n=1 Tax=Lysinibacillus boronitolerans TaxID=309788 RepID=UPI0002E11AB8|nr:type II toxin-antitoxin system PemK/MazF family toxin [Lysinibacillus boronitolerans]